MINDVVVFLDREQGAVKTLEQKKLKLHSVMTMSEMLQVLEEEKMLDLSLINSIRSFISSTQIAPPEDQTSNKKKTRITYSEKAKLIANPVAKKLLEIMEQKQTNLSVAVDVTTKSELLQIVDQVGKSICLLKTHIDTLEDFDPSVLTHLKTLAEKHHFLIFVTKALLKISHFIELIDFFFCSQKKKKEDRKFADIGNTVRLQYEKGIYKIVEWADLVNAHIISGPGIINGLKQAGLPRGRALLLLAEMSSGSELFDI